ncbi:MAG: DNA-binding XRE family transcriptional regulator [Myxococcota bacterium]|jgi:DNA-binding XRE family transcriptional regulator
MFVLDTAVQDGGSMPDMMKRQRQFLGLTQAELAEKLGVSRGYVSQIEASLRTPSACLVLALETLVRDSTPSPEHVGTVRDGAVSLLFDERLPASFTLFVETSSHCAGCTASCHARVEVAPGDTVVAGVPGTGVAWVGVLDNVNGMPVVTVDTTDVPVLVYRDMKVLARVIGVTKPL